MMKLYSDATTPFGRKIMIAAIERAIPIEEVFVDLKDASILDPWNPLRQIPTLVLDSGEAVVDSDVIMAFLDTCHSGPPLVPKNSAIAVMTRVSIANGLMETTLKRLGETRREIPAAPMMAKFEGAIARTLNTLETKLPDLAIENNVLRGDHIATAAALGYVDLRYTDAWKVNHPALAEWYAVVCKRDSVKATAPSRAKPIKP